MAWISSCAGSPAYLVVAMNAPAGNDPLSMEFLKAQIEARDRDITNPDAEDTQVMNIRNARTIRRPPDPYRQPHRILIRARPPDRRETHILTRKTLGGFETDPRFPRLRPGRQDHAGALRRGRSGRLRRRDARLSLARRGISVGARLFSGSQRGPAAAKAVS